MEVVKGRDDINIKMTFYYLHIKYVKGIGLPKHLHIVYLLHIKTYCTLQKIVPVDCMYFKICFQISLFHFVF